VGRQLARRGLLDALRLGLRKIVVEVVADQTPAINMFQAIGFSGEALLRDYVRDRSGELRDLVLLAHSVDDRSSAMATLGIDEAVKSR
jgi:RimJ/RimL family protein N-acetyltransferase